MPKPRWCTLACLLVIGLSAAAPAVSAAPARTCPVVYRAARCPGVAIAHRLRFAHEVRAWPRRYHSRTGWRPVIRPFDQAEAEAEVHAIAPYRTYPFYPLFPEVVAPYPYAWYGRTR